MFRKMMAILALTTLFSTAACTDNGITGVVDPLRTPEPVQETEEPTKEEMTPF